MSPVAQVAPPICRWSLRLDVASWAAAVLLKLRTWLTKKRRFSLRGLRTSYCCSHQGTQTVRAPVPVGSKGPHRCCYYPGMPAVWTWPLTLFRPCHASLVWSSEADFSVWCFLLTTVRGDVSSFAPTAGLPFGDASLTWWIRLHLCQVTSYCRWPVPTLVLK